ncbi:hypothetical protein CDCA_CDCA06G1812 [Cyanidium caldarium]|uniref:Uncharacterized protein n=1 Tax=Cyanidium caldarium TaxID=2771 RepID=A0AAV9ITX9_CYACA|nr:hypothetical protein CDCA_CDCA06G1812 [Cyanidium caldarium]
MDSWEIQASTVEMQVSERHRGCAFGVAAPGRVRAGRGGGFVVVDGGRSVILSPLPRAKRATRARPGISRTIKLDAAPDTHPFRKARSALLTVHAFTRPHTVRGTLLASVTGCARALMDSRAEMAQRVLRTAGNVSAADIAWIDYLRVVLDWSLLPRALLGVVALLLGNAFIVGVNQIYDQEVDRVNKPFLPLAAGTMTPAQAWALCLASVALGTLIVWRTFSRVILYLYVSGMVLGALYSVPPFRLRNVPLAAALIIACVRGFLLNFGVYYATREALLLPFRWLYPIRFLAFFMSVFAFVIALTKDLPDIEGDRQHRVPTFATQVGSKRMVILGSSMLFSAYMTAVVYGTAPGMGRHFRRWTMVGGHAFLAWYLVRHVYGRLMRQGPENRPAIREFYRGIWRLFYWEYLLFVFI